MTNKIFRTALKAVFLVTALFATFSLSAAKKSSTPPYPDFAYPKSVAKEAGKLLDKALASQKPEEALRELLNLTVAENLVSSENTFSLLPRIDSIVSPLPTPYSGVGYLIESEIYSAIYNAGRGRYNSRTVSENFDADNPQFWDSALFAKKISTLLKKALEEKDAASSTPLSAIKSLITPSDKLESFTVYDFMVYKTLGLKSNILSDEDRLIPFFKQESSQSISSSVLIDRLLALHRDPSPARTSAILYKVGQMNPEEGRPFLYKEITANENSIYSVPLITAYYSQFIAPAQASSEDNFFKTEIFTDFFSLLNRLRSNIHDREAADGLDAIYKRICAESVAVKFPSLVESNKPFETTVQLSNLNKCYLLLLDASTVTENNVKALQAKKLKVLSSREVAVDQPIPFFSTDTVAFTVPGPGKYIIVASLTQKTDNIIMQSESEYFTTFRASDIDMLTVNPQYEAVEDQEGCFVVKSSDSSPVKGADVEFRPYRNYNNKRDPGVIKASTDASGFAAGKVGNCEVTARFQGSKADGNLYASARTPSSSLRLQLFASQSVYHPGDTVQFLGVMFRNEGSRGEIVKDKEVTLSLFDANYQAVDTLSLVSDKSGRIYGSFPIPKDGLLGGWSLRGRYAVDSTDPNKQRFEESSLFIEVADYKVPSFMVTLEKKEAADSICFDGLALTYSGMPVASAKVTYDITYLPAYLYRWYGEPEKQYSAETETDGQGRFTVNLPLDNLNPKEYRGVFRISARVVDQAGETAQSSPVPFWIANTYNLSASIPEFMKVTGKEVELEVKTTDAIGMPTVLAVEYNITDSTGKIISEGTFSSPMLKIDSSLLPSGRYNLQFRIKEEDTDWSIYSTVFYRSTDPVPPVETALWCPETKVTASKNSRFINVGFGSSFKGQNILCVVSTSEGKCEKKWIVSDGTNTDIKVDVPGDYSRTFVTFYTYRDHQLHSQEVVVIPYSQTEKFEIETVTFRNSLTAGEKEHWEFKIKEGDKPVRGYAYALLYDKAMDAVSPLNWVNSLFTPFYPQMLSLSGNSRHVSSEMFRRSKTGYINSPQPAAFEFNTYGYPLFSYINYSQMRTLSRSAKTAASPMVMDSMNGTMAVQSKKMDAGVMTEEAAVDDMALFAAAEMETPAAGVIDEKGARKEEEDIKPRQVEMPVAFFKPDLNSDNNGIVKIDFEVPDFNTTWNLVLGAYTANLQSATVRLEAVASKTVMVKMAAPRFLRTGDRVVLTATLYNNSAEPLPLSGIYEVFNPLTGELLQSTRSAEETVMPSGSRVFSTEFNCPYDISAVGLRVFGVGGNSKDGEQTIIPVLPSSQPVIESKPFYLNPGEESFTIAIPDYPENAGVTFTYCDNPIWEVVTALPAIVNPDTKSLPSLSSSFYANGVGKGLMEKYPSIRKGLSMIVNGEAGDSLLISNLEKNRELKVVTLNNTPWVNNAANENLRLSRLSSLLDTENADAALVSIWKGIMNLHNPDGGWSWCPQMESSLHITEDLLLTAGMLKADGYLPSIAGMNTALLGGVKYCDGRIVEDYNKYGKKSEDSFMWGLWSYLFTRSFYPESQPGVAFNSIRKKALNILEKDWRKGGIFEKATIALTLWRNGKQKTALQILESLREYATFNVQGVHFDNLQAGFGGSGKLATTARVLLAFSEIRPEDEIIDGLRRWMLLQKQAQDWQEGANSVYAINALLSKGTEWTGEYPAPEITVDGRRVEPNEIERLTGACKVNIEASSAGNGEVSIRRFSPTQAWGGIISQFIAPMEDVKSQSISELSIRKDYLKITEKSGNVKAVEPKDVKVGDKIRVTLTVDCGRDMDYVIINDERGACLEPVEQLSGYTCIDRVWCYREMRNNATNIFIPFLPKGRFVMSYDCYVSEEGTFAAGIATIQCLYSPVLTAHSAGSIMKVSAK